MQFKLDPRLARVLGIHTQTRPVIINALWQYIKTHKLQDPYEREYINCDKYMEQVGVCGLSLGYGGATLGLGCGYARAGLWAIKLQHRCHRERTSTATSTWSRLVSVACLWAMAGVAKSLSSLLALWASYLVKSSSLSTFLVARKLSV